jgi:predicted porin
LSIGLTAGGSKYQTNQLSNVFLATGSEIKTNVKAIGASYDLGVAKLYAYTGDRKTEAATKDEVSVKVNRIGVQVPMGSFRFIATMGNIKGKEAGVEVVERKTKQLGALYSLSKRTTLFGLYGSDKDGTSMTGFTTDGAGVNTATTSTDTTTYRVGINHSF